MPEERSTEAPAHGVSFAKAARFWIKLGLINFGGPTGQHRCAGAREDMLDERRLPRAGLAGDQDDRGRAPLSRGQGTAENGALGVAAHQHPAHAPSLPSPPPRRKIPGALG